MISGEIKSENAFLRDENQPCFQIRPAFKKVRRNLSDAGSSMEVRLTKTCPHLSHGGQCVGLLARDAPAETRRGSNRARH
jgi:hypothetical protein